MKYRKFGKTGFEISTLGFGAMRLPMLKNARDDRDVDEKEAIKMLRYAIDNGINYIDSAYIYHGGLSEVIVGKALKDGYRKKVKIATKFPVGFAKDESDFDRILDEQLKRFDTDIIDFYLFHGLGAQGWEEVKGKNFLKKMEIAKKQGKIGHIGFSFHDNFTVFKKIIDEYDKWEFCQIQFNYMDINNQATEKGLFYAADKELGVIIMEPLLGGRLAKPPKDVKEIIISYKKIFSPANWAFRFLFNYKEISCVLSGMSSMEQLIENLKIADEAKVDNLDKDDKELIKKIREQFKKRAVIPCTGCKYCMNCPNGVNIPLMFSLYNEGVIYDDMGAPRFTYGRWVNENEKANLCTACKKCEEKCPQKIKISEWMPIIHKTLS